MFSMQKSMQQFLQEHTLRPASYVHQWQSTLVVAPHPQDEIAGCGGALAMLRQLGFAVKVLYVTHGQLGNMENPQFTKPLIKKIREQEVLHTLAQLGLSGQDAAFLHIQEGLVPGQYEPGFEEVSRLCLNELAAFAPHTVLLPYRYHPYRDHHATWQVMQDALTYLPYQVHQAEYMIWREADESQELISTDQRQPWRLDIQPVLEQKINALEERYQSSSHFIRRQQVDQAMQTTQPWETFLE